MNIYIAPMAGITDFAFREVTNKFSPNLMFTEMVNANLVMANDKTTMNELLKREHNESVQIFGYDFNNLINAFIKLESLGVKHLDLNLGCPKTKIIKTGAGSALLPQTTYVKSLLTEIRRKLKDSTELSIKIRIAYKDFNDPEFYVTLANQLGLKYICVHGRTREQEYSGEANWNIINRLSSLPRNIEFIGNGDLFDAHKIVKLYESNNIDGVMLARGIIGNPWLITQVREVLTDGIIKTIPTFDDIKNTVIDHYELCRKHKGEIRASLEMKKLLKYYFKNFPNIKNELHSILLDNDYYSTLNKIKNIIYY